MKLIAILAIEPVVFLVEHISYLLQQHIAVAIEAWVLTGGYYLLKDFVGVGHVEVAAQGQRARAPVVAAQHRVGVGQAAAAGGAVAQVSHIYLADKGRILLHLVDAQALDVAGQVAPHLIEDDGYGVFAEGALAEYQLVAGRGMGFYYSKPRSLLAAVVLLLHQQVQLVEGVGVCAVFLFVVLKRAA